MSNTKRLNCPYCGSTDTQRDSNPNRRPQKRESINALFRFARCRSCGKPFATVELVVGSAAAEAVEELMGGWDDDAEDDLAQPDTEVIENQAKVDTINERKSLQFDFKPVRFSRSPQMRETESDGYIWLREQYKAEHGSMKGWEAYCREYGIVSTNSQLRYWGRERNVESNLLDTEVKGFWHCDACRRKAEMHGDDE